MFRFLLVFSFLTSCGAYAETVTVDNKRLVEVIGVVDSGIISEATRMLSMAAPTTKNKKDIWLLVNSPGGMVDPGLVFINSMEIARKRGYKLRCTVGVLAASMAFQILSHCDSIYALPNSKLLFHPVRIQGTFTKDQLAYYLDSIISIEQDMNKQLLDYFKFDKTLFNYHYQMETLWESYQLAEHTDKITIVEDIQGTDKLFTYQKPRGFFFQINQGIVYIMPSYLGGN